MKGYTITDSHMEIGAFAGRTAGGELPAISPDSLVRDGSVDFRGTIADRRNTGGWKAAPFIIVNEVAERMAFYAIFLNLVIYLQKEMHEDVPDASTSVTNWTGTAFTLTVIGAFLADSSLGRFLTIVVFSCVYALGVVLLTISASVDKFRPPPCQLSSPECRPATAGQNSLLYGSLYVIALGTGGIKPCISSFGADQFDDSDPDESHKKASYFNWFYFAINFGVLLGITVVAYVEDRKGYGWGFGMSAAGIIASLVVLFSGSALYRYQRPKGSPFTRFLQVLVAASRNRNAHSKTELFEVSTKESAIHGVRKLPHTDQMKFLDAAAAMPPVPAGVSRWRLCTVTQVEEFKCFLRVLPIWVATLEFFFAFAQINLFISQAIIMNRRLGPHFTVPPGSVTIFTAANAIIFIPLYERYGVRFIRRFTGHPRGLSPLKRIGIGLASTIPTFAIAAAVEHHRRESQPRILTFWWLLPQFFLLGTGEVFIYVSQLEFFYNEASDGTKSLSSALFLTAFGLGSWLSTAVVKTVQRATGGKEKGWLRKNLNHSKLDYYYWVVCLISAVNFLVYLMVARFFKGKGAAGEYSSGEVNEQPVEMKEEDGLKLEAVNY